jgi:hypothetical protein
MSKNIEAQNIEPRAPLRLALAAKIAFPDGSMTASGLRRELLRGRLEVERIAGKDYTTLEAINRMREQCRVQTKALVSTRDARGSTGENSSLKPFGSSEMVNKISPQDALRIRLKQSRLKEPSKP